MNSLITKLNASRKELLDLGLRNPLINFRTKKNKIEVADELSQEVYRILVTENKTMKFKHVPEKIMDKENQVLNELFKEEDFDWSKVFAEEEIDNERNLVSRYIDTNLQTRLDSSSLHAKLLTMQNGARTYIEEQGVNVLYLALGFLSWYEADSSDKTRKAPIILVPVELTRSSAKERFSVSYTGEDIGHNLSLYEKLKNEFYIGLPIIDDFESIDLDNYYGKIERAISGQVRWSVNKNEIVLGFFSFGKFIMYKDLDENAWPISNKPQNHTILQSLLENGFRDEQSILPEDSNIDDLISPYDNRQIVDSDSSQTLAILDVMNGRNMVIQGPPGTGKSQTITNIIAEALSKQKKVLFVAEKMAALEVVKRRLDVAGLGDAVLEIHSHKTNKKLFLDEIRRTLTLGSPIVDSKEDDLKSFTEFRDRLNAYCKAINTKILNSNTTPFMAIGHLSRLTNESEELPKLDFTSMKEWSTADYKSNRLRVEELQRRLVTMGVPRENPFCGSKLKVLLATEEKRIGSLVHEFITLMEQLQEKAYSLSKTIMCSEPITFKDIRNNCAIAIKVSKAPNLQGINISNNNWSDNSQSIDNLISYGKRLYEIHKRYDAILIDNAWQTDVSSIYQNYMLSGKKWWRFFSSRFRDAKKSFQGLCRNEMSKDYEIIIQLLTAIMEAQQTQKNFDQNERLGETLFGFLWKKENSPWDVISSLKSWIVKFYSEIKSGTIPKSVLKYLESANHNAQKIESDAENLILATENCLQLLLQISQELQFDFLKIQKDIFINDCNDIVLDFLKKLFILWSNNHSQLSNMVKFNLLAEEFNDLGLSFILPLAETWVDANKNLVNAFDISWYNGLLNYSYSERKELRQFDRDGHEFAIEKFRELDKLIFQYNKAKLAELHWKSIPNFEQGAGALAVLKRELNKKRKHLPIRQLMVETGDVIKAIKPVFMMGPLSIATYLPPGSVSFDLIIFDEASQVKPVDAFVAILRGKQVVVIGDSKQLPPTSFFESMSGDTENDDDDDTSLTSDMESILGLFLAQNAPERMLKWHYRSKHDSLIAVSNYEFYDNKLIVFPSPGANSEARGLIFNYIPDTYYDRGMSRTNPEEAKAVAHAVMKHAQEQPHLTLGVAAFSTGQRDAIQYQLELLRRQDSSYEDFFYDHIHEPFFIKNLENVQGDERDVIFISIGYGKTKGNDYLSMNFGPLNKDGGERRLNVLISRAKKTCQVFANFTAEDIDLSRTNARGVVTLKRFLEFAKTRRLEIALTTGKDTDSPFEDQVILALTKYGYSVEPQVGFAGFRIDIGVKDENKPGRFLVGIECDGATYHSAYSARDRDRLRQEVLENLGWRIHRIWGPDWFRNQEKETKRTIEAIEKAKVYWSGIDTGELSEKMNKNKTKEKNSELKRENNEKSLRAKIEIFPYKGTPLKLSLGTYELHELPLNKIVECIKVIVDYEGPVHKEIVMHRIVNSVGIRRVGNRIRKAIENGISNAKWRGLIKLDKEFVNGVDKKVILRDRSNLELLMKKPEMIPPSELQLAFESIVKQSFSISKEEIVIAGFKLLGISRVTSGMIEYGNPVLASCLKQKLFTADEKGNLKTEKK